MSSVTSMRSVRFQYVHISRRRHPITVAYRAGEGNGMITIMLGVAFCHSNDRFNRSLGREIAEGRMNAHPVTFQVEFDSQNTSAYGRVIAEAINSFVTDNYYALHQQYSSR